MILLQDIAKAPWFQSRASCCHISHKVFLFTRQLDVIAAVKLRKGRTTGLTSGPQAGGAPGADGLCLVGAFTVVATVVAQV